MRFRAFFVVVCVAVSAAVLAASAGATRVSISGHSQAQVKKSCSGVYWPGSGKGNTYGCLNDDGSGIVCGGVTKSQQKTCDTFDAAPKGSSYAHQIGVALGRARR